MHRLKKLLKEQIASLRLTTKFTLLMVLFMLLPLAGVVIFSAAGSRKTMIDDHAAALRGRMEQSVEQIESAAATCVLTAGGILDNRDFLRQLDRIYRSQDPPSPIALRRLYQTQLLPLERMCAAVPGISEIRVYQSDPRIPEIFPTLLPAEQIRGQGWYTSGLFENGAWKYNLETASGSHSKTALFLREFRTESDGLSCILTVSTPMELLLPDLFETDDIHWAGFVDANNTLYHDREGAGQDWLNMVGTIVYTANSGEKGYVGRLMNYNGHTLLTASIPVPALSGRLVRAELLDADLIRIRDSTNLCLLLLLSLNILGILLLNRLVRLMLRRFYRLVSTIHEVERGNLEVEVPDSGRDEIGELAQSLREMTGRLQSLMRQSVQRELLVKNSEIRALQNQINAHFIYNILEAIKMMAEIDEEFEISDAVTSLGKLLRYSMKWTSPMVTLGEELEYIRHYIALLNLRYDHTITLSVAVAEDLRKQRVPKMSLQPVVENAVYHGIEGLDADAVIRIVGKPCENFYEVEITDSGRGMQPGELEDLRRRINGKLRDSGREHHGIGLKNVQDRIRLNYGPDYGIRVSAKENCYTKVILRFPFSEEGEKDGTSAHCGGRKDDPQGPGGHGPAGAGGDWGNTGM